MIRVNAKARRHEDRAGDPLDGLVNLFDVGIVLAVAFLLAALSSLNLTDSITKTGLQRPPDTIIVPSNAVVSPVPTSGPRTAGRGTQVGTVYRLKNGQLIYVVSPTASPSATHHAVSFFSDGLDQAWDLIVGDDPYLRDVTWVTIKVATIPTAIALVLGLPVALALGIGRFRGRRVGIALANAGLALPPVAVGLVLTLLMFPEGPLFSLHLLFTLRGVYLAQTLLALPIIVALSAAAISALPDGLLDQARAFGAGRVQLSVLALREARIGILAAIIAAVGSGLSEVGAVVLVGGNIAGLDQTLASAALQKVDAGQFAAGLAIAIILLGLIILTGGLLTVLQFRSPTVIRPGARS